MGARSAFIDAPCAGGTTQDFTFQTLNQFGPRGTKDPQQGSSPTAKHCLHPPALTLSLPTFAAEQPTSTVGFPLYTEKAGFMHQLHRHPGAQCSLELCWGSNTQTHSTAPCLTLHRPREKSPFGRGKPNGNAGNRDPRGAEAAPRASWVFDRYRYGRQRAGGREQRPRGRPRKDEASRFLF